MKFSLIEVYLLISVRRQVKDYRNVKQDVFYGSFDDESMPPFSSVSLIVRHKNY